MIRIDQFIIPESLSAQICTDQRIKIAESCQKKGANAHKLTKIMEELAKKDPPKKKDNGNVLTEFSLLLNYPSYEIVTWCNVPHEINKKDLLTQLCEIIGEVDSERLYEITSTPEESVKCLQKYKGKIYFQSPENNHQYDDEVNENLNLKINILANDFKSPKEIEDDDDLQQLWYWLKYAPKLPQYYEFFKNCGITNLEKLTCMENVELLEIGMNRFADRKRLLNAIKQRRKIIKAEKGAVAAYGEPPSKKRRLN